MLKLDTDTGQFSYLCWNEVVSKVLFWILFPLCNFGLYFVILYGSMI